MTPLLDETQASRTKVHSLTCTPKEWLQIKRVSEAKEEPVAHLLRRHLDWDAIRSEYDRFRALFGDPPKVNGNEPETLPDSTHETGAGA